MARRSFKLYGVITAAAALLLFGACANAQTLIQSGIEARLAAAVSKLENACSDDLKKYCSTVTPGEGRFLLCLEAHEDKIGSRCDYALFDAARNLDRALDRIVQAADACWSDIAKHCAGIPEGGGRIAQCLIAKKTSLNDACQIAISKFQPGK